MKKQIWLGCLVLLSFLSSVAQTDKEKAKALLKQAIRIMDQGDIDESIVLLDSARKLDPTNFVYDYETGFAYQMKKDYKNAIRHFEATLKFENINDQCYQMLGNNYDYDGDSIKAVETYYKGLEKFPKSGKLYLELGVMSMGARDYNKAVELWEKGVTVDPYYPSNYYRLAKLYSLTIDRIWAIFYGEMFLNLEASSARSKDISKLIYEAYKESITLTDTSAKIDFARPVIEFDGSKKFKFPFDQVYGMDFSVGVSLLLIGNNKEVDIAFLSSSRAGFVDWWYKQKRDKDYNNIVIEYQKKVKDNGHMEAYNYWLLQYGNETEFKSWYNKNQEKFNAFAEWFQKNDIELNSKHYFLRTVID